MSRALISLVDRGLRAELEAKENPKATNKRFLDEQEPARKSDPGQDLVALVDSDPTALAPSHRA